MLLTTNFQSISGYAIKSMMLEVLCQDDNAESVLKVVHKSVTATFEMRQRSRWTFKTEETASIG